MLGLDPLRLAGLRLALHEVVQPQVAFHVPRDLSARPFVHDHAVDGVTAAHPERFVNGRLERDGTSATHLLIRGDDGDGAGIDDALVDALRGETTENDGMDRADPRARLHRDDHLDRHRHVNDHAVAFANAARLEPVREHAHPAVKLLVRDPCDLPVVRLENDGRLVRLRFEVSVEAVVRRVEGAVVKPFEEGRLRFVDHRVERLLPDDFLAREPAPESVEVLFGLGAEPAIRVHAGNVRLLHSFGRRRKDAVFLQD
jgi:hypothetical protein